MLKTKKRMLSVFTGIVLAICMAFALVGCGETAEGGRVTEEHEVLTDFSVEMNKKMYLQILTALLEQREKFEFDNKENAYILKDTVDTTISQSVYGETVSFAVTMKDSVVRFNDEGKPVYFQCDCTMLINDFSGFSSTVNTKGEWTFSDYGTTTIQE